MQGCLGANEQVVGNNDMVGNLEKAERNSRLEEYLVPHVKEEA